MCARRLSLIAASTSPVIRLRAIHAEPRSRRVPEINNSAKHYGILFDTRLRSDEWLCLVRVAVGKVEDMDVALQKRQKCSARRHQTLRCRWMFSLGRIECELLKMLTYPQLVIASGSKIRPVPCCLNAPWFGHKVCERLLGTAPHVRSRPVTRQNDRTYNVGT